MNKRVRTIPPSRTTAPGFTLMEIMVVIAIIVIVAGVGIYAGRSIINAAKISQTKTIMQQLLAVDTEYRVNQLDSIERHDLDQIDATRLTTDPGYSIAKFVEATWEDDMSKPLLKTLGDKFLIDTDDDRVPNTVQDSWNNPFQYRPQVRYDGDPFSMPKYDRPFFASSGPDGEWGTDDDLFSFNSD